MMDKMNKPDGVAVIVSEEPSDPKAKALAIAKKALAEIAECCAGDDDSDGEEDIDAMLAKSMG